MIFKTKRNTGLILIFVIFAGLLTSVWWELNRVNNSILQETTVVAKNYLDVLESFRQLYSSEVVSNIGRSNVQVTHNYQNYNNAIPLPATMTFMLAERASLRNNALDVVLYSDYPFPWRKNKNINEADITLLNKLRDNPEKDLVNATSINGEPFIRVVRADVMLESCVSCHNSHPSSPKTDWKVGDVRGALSVTVSLNQTSSVSRSVLKEIMLLILITSIVVITIIALLVLEESDKQK